jgi:uncharacterized membrane protein
VQSLLLIADVALRWLHVIAGIMWIGNSLLFNWLDRSIRPAAAPRDRSLGEIWLLHSGGFYQVEKTLALNGHATTRDVHWFKWQAYTTWLSGAALLITVYYATGGALLANPDNPLPLYATIGASIAVFVIGWKVYDGIWRSPLKQRSELTAGLCFILLLLLGWVLLRVFTGRAAFLHIGALLGTLMVGNVAHHIMTAQRAFIAEIESGVPGDERLSHAAKLRSIHNNYMTFPVIVLMLSSHFPLLYAAPHAWAVLGVLLLAGAGIRHILNVRWTFAAWPSALAGTVAVTLLALYVLTLQPTRARAAADDAPVDIEAAVAVVHKRCTVCHSVSPADRTFGAPAGGIMFDTEQQIAHMSARIEARAVVTRTMPPANQTHITEDERALLARWAEQRRLQR